MTSAWPSGSLTERELNRSLARLPREARPALEEEVERLSDFLA